MTNLRLERQPLGEPFRPAADRSRFPVGAALFAAVGVLLMIGLGVWQVERLSWKEGLIAAIAARTSAAPEPFPDESHWAGLNPAHDEYRHVRLTGRFLPEHEAHVQANLVAEGPRDGELGYDIVTPLRLTSGGVVLVNRGFVPLNRKDRASRPETAAGAESGETVVTGLIRFPQYAPFFAPADNPARNVWFSRDPVAIARAHGLERVAPVLVDADVGQSGGHYPIGGQSRLTLVNNHLQYAVTWFGLAATLAGIFGFYAWQKMSGRASTGTAAEGVPLGPEER